jgi:hypothetical protein
MTAAVLIATPEPVDCPACGGQGFTSEPLFERHVVADSIERECGACQGTGEVDGERVRECEHCLAVYLAEIGGCEHQNLCGDCLPHCRPCSRAVGQRLLGVAR